MAAYPHAFDWEAAKVPSGLTDEAEAEREERERAKSREKKKRAEKARKERKRLEGAERAARDAEGAAALAALDEVVAGDDMRALGERIEDAVEKGVQPEALEEARARLDALRLEAADPEVQKRKERERRAAAAEARFAKLASSGK